jgi:hypothetical protein
MWPRETTCRGGFRRRRRRNPPVPPIAAPIWP